MSTGSAAGPIIVVAVAAVLLLGYVDLFAAHAVTHGFVASYAASRLLLAGQLGPHVY